jgi:hypothetical protein
MASSAFFSKMSHESGNYGWKQSRLISILERYLNRNYWLKTNLDSGTRHRRNLPGWWHGQASAESAATSKLYERLYKKESFQHVMQRIPVHVITASAALIEAAMRYQFGGHLEKPAENSEAA